MIWKWGTPLELETENYILRSIDPENIPEQLVDWYADPEVMRYMNDTPNLNRQQLSNMFSLFNNKTKFALLALSKPDEKPIGFFRIFIEGRNSKAETNVLIGDKQYWGQNAVIEMRSSIMQFLFSGLKLNKICGSIRARNFPALFNYTRQGFDREGVLKKQVMGRDGEFEDIVVFGMTRDMWMTQNKSRLAAEQTLSNEPSE